MNTEIKTKIEDFLGKLDTEIDVKYMVNIDDIDCDNPYDSIYEMIENNNGFDQEVIYYSKAIKYLSDNDPSLRDSLELAHDMGYTADKINSELLATLLKSQNVRDDFSDLKDEIEEFFAELAEEVAEIDEATTESC